MPEEEERLALGKGAASVKSLPEEATLDHLIAGVPG